MAKDTCSVPNCGSEHYSRGFCQTHYHRWRRGVSVGAEPTHRKRSLQMAAPTICGDVASVPLTRGLVAIIDASDAEAVGRRIWNAVPSRDLTWYARASSPDLPDGRRGAPTPMHRFIMGLEYGDPRLADHIDGDGLNNRRSNLRVVTGEQNAHNRRAPRGALSPFKGVYHMSGMWCAHITARGEHTWRGGFGSEIEAAHAYDAMARELHGEFARLNFPDEP